MLRQSRIRKICFRKFTAKKMVENDYLKYACDQDNSSLIYSVAFLHRSSVWLWYTCICVCVCIRMVNRYPWFANAHMPKCMRIIMQKRQHHNFEMSKTSCLACDFYLLPVFSCFFVFLERYMLIQIVAICRVNFSEVWIRTGVVWSWRTGFQFQIPLKQYIRFILIRFACCRTCRFNCIRSGRFIVDFLKATSHCLRSHHCGLCDCLLRCGNCWWHHSHWIGNESGCIFVNFYRFMWNFRGVGWNNFGGSYALGACRTLCNWCWWFFCYCPTKRNVKSDKQMHEINALFD